MFILKILNSEAKQVNIKMWISKIHNIEAKRNRFASDLVLEITKKANFRFFFLNERQKTKLFDNELAKFCHYYTPLQSPNLPWKHTTSITKPPVEIHHFNHQTSHGNTPLQSPNLPWKHTTSITKPPVDIHYSNHQTSRGYPPLQSPNLPWKSPFLSIRQPVENTWPWTCFLYLPHQLTPPSSTAKDKWIHILLHPFWAWHPLMQPRGLDMAI